MEKATKKQLGAIKDLLREKRARDEAGLFVAEGLKIVRELIEKSHDVDLVVVSSGFADDPGNRTLLDFFAQKNIPCYSVPNPDFERISSLKQSQGILASVKMPARPDISSLKDARLIVLCDGVQDPGNIGAMIRNSVALGVDALVLMGGSADPFNPKVVRAAGGMVLDIPICECGRDGLDGLRKAGFKVYVSSARGKNTVELDEIENIPPKVIVVLGSEGKGVSPEIAKKADVIFTIPVKEKAESLNVGAAAAIILYKFSKR